MKKYNIKNSKFKKKKKFSPESELLNAIYQSHGGLTATAKQLNVTKQLLNFWRNQGFVSLTRVHEVASKLHVPVLALNYAQMCKFVREQVPFDEVRDNCLKELRQ